MAGRDYFGKRFIGMNISFTQPHPSTWTLVAKVKEKYLQLDESDTEAFQATSSAWAMFTCRNVDDPDEEVLMRISMQISYLGSEFDLSGERATQASETLGSFAQSEFDALRCLTERRCKSTPTLLGYKKDKQDENMLIPGGYIFYLLMTRLPGILLGTSVELDSLFWTLPSTTRDDIREAFKVAYMNLLDGGIYPKFPGFKHLLWDEALK